MFLSPDSDAPASTVSSASAQPIPPQPPPAADDSSVRHMLFGTPSAVQKTVHTLHSRGYAEPNDWSPPISTGRCNEVMRILIKRITS